MYNIDIYIKHVPQTCTHTYPTWTTGMHTCITCILQIHTSHVCHRCTHIIHVPQIYKCIMYTTHTHKHIILSHTSQMHRHTYTILTYEIHTYLIHTALTLQMYMHKHTFTALHPRLQLPHGMHLSLELRHRHPLDLALVQRKQSTRPGPPCSLLAHGTHLRWPQGERSRVKSPPCPPLEMMLLWEAKHCHTWRCKALFEQETHYGHSRVLSGQGYIYAGLQPPG